MFPDVDPQIVDDFKALRTKHKAPITRTAIQGIVREAEKAGLTLEGALRICCERGWRSLKAEWITQHGVRAGPGQSRAPVRSTTRPWPPQSAPRPESSVTQQHREDSMTHDDYEDCAGMVDGITELYGRAASECAITIWWNALRQYDLAAVRQAFDLHVRNPDSGQFAPKPADLIRMIGGMTQDSALVAWAKVDRALRVVGTYRSVAFDDAMVHRVLTEMGGWTALGTKSEKEWPFVAKEFENRCRGYRMRNECPDYPPILVGLAEAQNAQAGFEGESPTLIGDQVLAHRVMACGSHQPLLEMRQASAIAIGATRTSPSLMCIVS